jgi:PAS domain-containing protein
MNEERWLEAFPGAVTICDPQGIILAMNEAAARAFQEQGGKALIGANALDCHPEPAREKMQHLLETQGTNVYTIEKGGKKRLIYQAPWYDGGAFGGLVELSLEIPTDMPHFVRDRPAPLAGAP